MLVQAILVLSSQRGLAVHLRRVFNSLHLHFSHLDFENNICLLIWGNAKYLAIVPLTMLLAVRVLQCTAISRHTQVAWV